jgi:hypothetical protein
MADLRIALRRLLEQIDLDEQIRIRAVQQAITEAEADYWHRRAADFDWADCPLTALACRRKAAFLHWEAGGPLIDPAEEAA